jgi:inorganic pyrophosphatase
MGSDLFGSYAESSCAALVISGTSQTLSYGNYYLFPLLITSSGLLVSLVTASIGLYLMKVNTKEKIQSTLKWQLYISTILLTPVLVLLALFALPENFSFISGSGVNQRIYKSTNWGVMVCILTGLYSGLIIGLVTDYFTSNEHTPVKNLAISCKSG